MNQQALYQNDFGEVFRINKKTLEINFKGQFFVLSLEEFMLLNGKLKRSPFVSVTYAPTPNYVVIEVGEEDVKLKLDSKDYNSFKDLLEGAASIIGIEEDLKKLI